MQRRPRRSSARLQETPPRPLSGLQLSSSSSASSSSPSASPSPSPSPSPPPRPRRGRPPGRRGRPPGRRGRPPGRPVSRPPPPSSSLSAAAAPAVEEDDFNFTFSQDLSLLASTAAHGASFPFDTAVAQLHREFCNSFPTVNVSVTQLHRRLISLVTFKKQHLAFKSSMLPFCHHSLWRNLTPFFHARLLLLKSIHIYCYHARLNVLRHIHAGSVAEEDLISIFKQVNGVQFPGDADYERAEKNSVLDDYTPADDADILHIPKTEQSIRNHEAFLGPQRMHQLHIPLRSPHHAQQQQQHQHQQQQQQQQEKQRQDVKEQDEEQEQGQEQEQHVEQADLQQRKRKKKSPADRTPNLKKHRPYSAAATSDNPSPAIAPFTIPETETETHQHEPLLPGTAVNLGEQSETVAHTVEVDENSRIDINNLLQQPLSSPDKSLSHEQEQAQNDVVSSLFMPSADSME